MINSIFDADGNTLPSMTESYLAWRAHCARTHRPMQPTFVNGTCSLCEGWRELQTSQYGRMWCICEVAKRTQELDLQHSEYRSISNADATLDNFEPWGTDDSQDQIIILTDYLKEWLMWPSQWVTLIGGVGSGKSHLLSALDKMLKPWSLFITVTDFESKAFKATKGKAEYTLEDMLSVIQQAPILLFDDLGLEHGSEYIVSLERSVMDFRYRRPEEYVTVVTTNKSRSKLYEWDTRVADRILDNKVGKLFMLDKIASRRRFDGNPY